MKQRLLSLVGVWILWLGAAVIQAGVSNPSNVASVTTPTVGGAGAVAEWYGPFSSWDNVKTKYGAKGDGVTDDTAAINNALANVGLNGNSPALYFPNGTYRVTAKLLLKNRTHVEILGASRDGTVLKYDGATDPNYSGPSTLFHADGIVECHFARITFDGNGKSKTLASESQSPSTPGQYFDSGSLWEDCVFQNAASGGHGVDAGYYGYGFAGVNFVRCIFKNLATGIITWNWNALDGWATDSYFENCSIALDVHQGSLHAYNSKFVNNGTDFLLEQASVFISLVSNTSYRAGAFCKFNNVGANTTPLLVKGNTVIDPTGVPIQMGQPGAVLLLDNTITSSGAAVACTHSMQVDLMAVGNTWTVNNWLSVSSGSGLRTNLVDNTVVSRSSLALAQPTAPSAASNLNRTSVNLAAGFTTADLQNAVNNAADGTVIHLPWSSNADQQWYLTATVTMPSGKDVRIVGDGPGTKLFWNGPNGSPMFRCPHPAQVTFSHLQLFGNSSGTAGAGIQVDGVGSSAARVYLRDVSMRRPINANLRLGDCPNTTVDWCSRGSSSDSPGFGSLVVLDGRGKVRYINTEGGGGLTDYSCTGGGQLYMETCYNEASDTTGHKILRVGGAGTVTLLSGKYVENIGSAGYSWSRATSNGFAAANFSGTLFFGLNSSIIDWWNISGPATGAVWLWGNATVATSASSCPILNSTAVTPVQTMNWYSNGGCARDPDVGTASAAYTRQMLAQARAEYADRSPLGHRTGQTDVLMEHVVFELSQQQVWIKP
jgi:hypothetical protein